MKKFISMALAVIMVIGSGVVAFAARDNGEFGIDYGTMDKDVMAPGQLYTFDLLTNDGSYVDADWKMNNSITYSITSGNQYIDKFYIAESKDDEFYELYVQTKGDADYSSNHKIKFTIMARNKYKDEDNKRGPEYGDIYRFEGELTAGFAKGHSDIIRDDFFTVDQDIPAVTLDKKLDVVTAEFPKLGYAKFRLASTYSYNFAYSTSVPKALLVEYPDTDIYAWNFHARPEFDTPATIEFLCSGKTYAYTKDDDNNLTEFPVTFKNGDRISFKTKKLDNYIFSNKPLKAKSASTTTTTEVAPTPTPPTPTKPAPTNPAPVPPPAPAPVIPAPTPKPEVKQETELKTFKGEPLATLIFGASF